MLSLISEHTFTDQVVFTRLRDKAVKTHTTNKLAFSDGEVQLMLVQ